MADVRAHLRDLNHDLNAGVVSGIRNVEPPWMAGFGVLSDLADENRRVLDAIEDEFERD